MIDKLIQELKKNNLSLSAAESVTGGRFSNILVNQKGASKFFKGSFICYSNDFKYNVLKVKKNIGTVTKEMALELSTNSRKILKTDLSISFTGNASDNGIEGKAKGLVFISISNNKANIVKEYVSLKKERVDIINDVSHFGIKILLEFIKNNY